MNDFKKCLKIESTFIEDKLIIPRKGECKIEIKDGCGELILRFKKDLKYFDSVDELILIHHKVFNKKFFSEPI
jgi:hypothetical protein